MRLLYSIQRLDTLWFEFREIRQLKASIVNGVQHQKTLHIIAEYTGANHLFFHVSRKDD